MVREQHAHVLEVLEKNPALKSCALEMQYHSPAGEPIDVLNVRYTKSSETLLLQGYDAKGNECQVVTQAQGIQLLIKIVPRPEPEPTRTAACVSVDPSVG